jgi:hypothetical protein
MATTTTSEERKKVEEALLAVPETATTTEVEDKKKDEEWKLLIVLKQIHELKDGSEKTKTLSEILIGRIEEWSKLNKEFKKLSDDSTYEIKHQTSLLERAKKVLAQRKIVLNLLTQLCAQGKFNKQHKVLWDELRKQNRTFTTQVKIPKITTSTKTTSA